MSRRGPTTSSTESGPHPDCRVLCLSTGTLHGCTRRAKTWTTEISVERRMVAYAPNHGAGYSMSPFSAFLRRRHHPPSMSLPPALCRRRVPPPTQRRAFKDIAEEVEGTGRWLGRQQKRLSILFVAIALYLTCGALVAEVVKFLSSYLLMSSFSNIVLRNLTFKINGHFLKVMVLVRPGQHISSFSFNVFLEGITTSPFS